MPKEDRKPFGATTFVLEDELWYHQDAEGKRVGGPYETVFVHKKPLVALVEDEHGFNERFIATDGRRLGEAFLEGNHRGFKNGPGGIVWIGPKSPEHDLVPRIAVLQDGTVVGTFDATSIEPYEDVRWVRKGKRWRLLGADGRLKGLRGISYASDFTQGGLALVRIGKRFAFLNVEGERAWRASYDDACDFFQGRAWVHTPEGWILIAAGGAKVGAHTYDEVDGADRDEPFSIARSGELWYLVRRKDGTRVPDEGFDEISSGYGATAFVLRKGKMKESFDARTGERKPYDTRQAHAHAEALMGVGGEWDD